MALQVNKLFRKALRNGELKAERQLYYYNKWDGYNIVWTPEYNMTTKWAKNYPYPIGHTLSRGVYMIIYIPTGEIMYIGEGKVWNRVGHHGRIYRSMQNYKTYKGWVKAINISYSRGGHECSKKMIGFDRSSLNLWSYKLCITDNKDIAKEYENALKESIKPPFNVKGYDIT